MGVKPAVFAFGFDVCFRGKKGVKIDTTVLGLNNGMEWNGNGNGMEFHLLRMELPFIEMDNTGACFSFLRCGK